VQISKKEINTMAELTKQEIEQIEADAELEYPLHQNVEPLNIYNDWPCPSVKTHPLNFVVLCPDHHTMFDGMNWEEREQLGFWETVRDRLILVYPDLAENERRHFPDSVLEYMKKHDAFSSL
jgi:hypothetical protein